MEGYGKGYIDNFGYYIGEWKNGLMDGEGTFYDKNGRIIFNGKIDGKKIWEMVKLVFGKNY